MMSLTTTQQTLAQQVRRDEAATPQEGSFAVGLGNALKIAIPFWIVVVTGVVWLLH
jgi:hypothetical protein